MDNIILSEYTQASAKYTFENAPNIYKTYLFALLSDKFKHITIRPVVDTGLGYYVDGGKNDLENFKIGQKFELPFIIDVEGHKHYIKQEQYDTIIEKIEENGIKLYQWKWGMKSKIHGLDTQEDFNRAKQEIEEKD